MLSKEEAYKAIEQLVIRFGEQIQSYKKTDYNETQARRDFIDPFFKALGWDVDNSAGNAEAYREVIHEDRIKVGGATKAPDYSFRLPGGKRLFFVEAKKPSVAVKTDIVPAYQVRRYAWSAKLPISLLTDFEELAVYDCNKKPKPEDKASIARIKYLTYDQYLAEFDFLWDTFSKERVLKGSFDKFIASDSNKKGTTTVDKDFLASLDEWRMELAQNIALRNGDYTEEELNYTVQQTIDRIIFLRIAEDRGVEDYGRLQTLLKGDSIYNNLYQYFTEADSKYNSGLFDFKRDKLSKDLLIDNKVLKAVISELYYPVSPYEFSVLSVEILGSAYEQFLGKQIKLNSRHKIEVDEKPEVRKAGGVYYTPQYIVDYIVKQTVGKLAEGKTPEAVSKLRIVDPACGSGSFLIGAYQYLLTWHHQYYKPEFVRLTEEAGNATLTTKQREAAIKQRNKLPLTPDGALTTAVKKTILLNNIYGVDIDTQAVEVTKLSLLLKCMEGETQSSMSAEMRFGERVLPTLDSNIKSGNSLIDLDFYDGVIDFEPAVEKRIKPFSWQRAFPEVFKLQKAVANRDFKRQYEKVRMLEQDVDDLLDKYNAKEPEPDYGSNKGFDIIIGNPPYGAAFSAEEVAYLRNRYSTAVWRGESYVLFIEQGVKLLKTGGQLGLIIPDTLLNLGFTQPARELLLRNSRLSEIVSLPSNVFAGATVDTIILLAEKADYTQAFHPSNAWIQAFGKRQAITSIENADKAFFVKAAAWHQQNAFNLQTDDTEKELLTKMEAGRKVMADIAEMYSGVKAYEVGKGNPPQTVQIRDSKPFTAAKKIDKTWRPFYDGKHIGRYELLWKENNWIKYGDWLAAPRKPANFEGEKILIRKITGETLLATYVPETSYCNTLLFVLKLTDNTYSYKAILAILNSKLIGWYFKKKFQISEEDTFPQIMIRDILQLPVPEINEKVDAELNKLVDQIMQANEEKGKAVLQQQVERLQERINFLEGKVNELVKELYSV